ncbi:hypothetical protein TanjilG_27890 [Lupinus angustifolius]|uniref:Uncharacterized protein n=1 Tax=Lupinus angustifolius TaxID=3871 RepID=A0A1J7FMB7_LUPAN|nr:hypothetical protein TanjilG_27890 [Lupinus angustifolius]
MPTGSYPVKAYSLSVPYGYGRRKHKLYPVKSSLDLVCFIIMVNSLSGWLHNNSGNSCSALK